MKFDAIVFIPFSVNRDGGALSNQSEWIVRSLIAVSEEERIDLIVLLGGYRKNNGLTEAELAEQIVRQETQNTGVALDRLSRNTEENAQWAIAMLRMQNQEPGCRGIERVLLCVQKKQAERTLGVFQRAAPEIYFETLELDSRVWSNNAKILLRNPYVFAIREWFVKIYYKLRRCM